MVRLSSKQKREIYSISGLLLHLIIYIVLLLTLNACELLQAGEQAPPATCDTFATVKDMRGLDGCGIILVLDDGQQLEPVMPAGNWCGTGSPTQAPALVDGKRVKIGYREVPQATICMMGKTVEITCISDIGRQHQPPAK